jgi:hypothetical protein
MADARLAQMGLYTDPNLNPPYQPSLEYPGVDGAFKAPSLRNVALTPPYFHTGSYLTLDSVLDFYSRGGDFQPIPSRDGAIFPLRTIALSSSDRKAVVALLQAFTDERVRTQKAPFDHPELFVPNGEAGGPPKANPDSSGNATDSMLRIPQVGAKGGPAVSLFH